MINEVNQEKQKIFKILSLSDPANRTLRSKESLDPSSFLTSLNNNNNKNNNKEKKKSNSNKDITQTITTLLEPIPEQEIRSDFLSIVRDLQAQAEAFQGSEAKVRYFFIFSSYFLLIFSLFIAS